MKKPMTTIRTKPVGLAQLKSENVAEAPEKAASQGLAGISKPNAPAKPVKSELKRSVSLPFDKARNLRGISAKDGTTKAKIERAALHLFAEHGVDGVSTKQIAAAAGISEGAIYRHFSGKEALARSMMVAIHGRLTDIIKAADEAHDNLDAKIQFIVTHYCRIADEDWDLFQYHILHLHHFPRLSDGPEDSPMGVAAMLLQKAMDDGEIEAMDANILAAMSLGVVVQAAQAKVFGYITGPLAARSDVFTKRVLAVVKAK